jgi:aspartate/methionine/tyrosine aminotransferase
MKPLSHITGTFRESVIREMTRICDSVNGSNLAQGFPDFEAPAELKQAAINAIQSGYNQYPVTFGEPELRDAISRKVLEFNHITCDPASEITVTCGATEAMIATLKALINPGDEIIIFEPFYENYGPDGILSGATPRYVALAPPDWTFSIEELNAAFNNKTKAIVINTPNNPTGKVFSKSELEVIAGLCQKWDVYAVTDEIYEHIIYDGKEHVSIASLPGMKDRTVTINSVSKTYSVTGWRVGWAIAHKEITSRIRKVHDFLTVGAPTPLQHAAVIGLGFGPEYYQSLCMRYQKSRSLLLDILKKAGFSPFSPEGAYYIITDISKLMKKTGCRDDFEFCQKLIEKTGIASVPGSSFFSLPERGRHLSRFCFCKRDELLLKVAGEFSKMEL